MEFCFILKIEMTKHTKTMTTTPSTATSQNKSSTYGTAL